MKKLFKSAILLMILTLVFTNIASAESVTTGNIGGDTTAVTTTDIQVKANTLSASEIQSIKPGNFKAASYSYNKIKCSWDKIDGVSGYNIYRATSKSGKYSKVYTTTDPNKTYYINSGRTTGQTYYYKIKAFVRKGSKTYYSKYSSTDSAYAKPSKTAITDAWGNTGSLLNIQFEWKTVSGATGYEQQINTIKNGKESGWKTYAYNHAGSKRNFTTYYTLLAAENARHPEGYFTTVREVNGKFIRETITNRQAVERVMKKNQAWIDVVQDESIYQFRVRAYRTVNGKKIYGLWSDAYTVKETANAEEIYKSLVTYTKGYAAKAYPEWTYMENTAGMTDNNSSYYLHGMLGACSRYARQEDIIKYYKERIKGYIDRMKVSGGQQEGFFYFKRLNPGDTKGSFDINDSDETYYYAWMLY